MNSKVFLFPIIFVLALAMMFSFVLATPGGGWNPGDSNTTTGNSTNSNSSNFNWNPNDTNTTVGANNTSSNSSNWNPNDTNTTVGANNTSTNSNTNSNKNKKSNKKSSSNAKTNGNQFEWNPSNTNVSVEKQVSGSFFLKNSNKGFEVEGEQGMFKLKSEKYSVDCIECDLTTNQGKSTIQKTLSNGKNAEIKIMPDQASQKALEKLKLKNCDESCTLELKEVGKNENMKLVYEMHTKEEKKLLGIFKAQLKANAKIDSETGEVISSGKSWWSFLAI